MLICKYRKASEEFNEIVYTIEGDIIYCDLTWEDQDIYSAYEEETPEELIEKIKCKVNRANEAIAPIRKLW